MKRYLLANTVPTAMLLFERLHIFRYVVLTRRNFSVTGGAKVNIFSVKTYSAFYFLSAYQSLTASYPAKDVYQDFSTA